MTTEKVIAKQIDLVKELTLKHSLKIQVFTGEREEFIKLLADNLDELLSESQIVSGGLLDDRAALSIGVQYGAGMHPAIFGFAEKIQRKNRPWWKVNLLRLG